MATLLGSSPAHLSRIETGQRRDALLTRHYEAAFGIPDSALGAPISTLCRAFPHRAPRDSGPLYGERDDVRAFSELTEHLLAGDSNVTGGEWLSWARSLSTPGNISLPLALFARIAQRLLDELDRSVQHGVAPRHEAVALIRGSAYGDALLEASRPFLTPGANHRPELLVSALGPLHDEESQAWALALMREERTAVWGALALETMSQSNAAPLWEGAASSVAEIHDASAPGSSTERWSAHLLRLVPPHVWHTQARPTRSLGDNVVDDWSAHPQNPLWAWCEQQASEMSARHGLAPQPILTRLVFDIAFGHREARALSAQLLLSALPDLADSLPARMAAYVDAHPDAPVRHRLITRLRTMAPATLPAACASWLTSQDAELRDTALTLAGRAGLTPDDIDGLTATDSGASTPLDADARAQLTRWNERGGRILC